MGPTLRVSLSFFVAFVAFVALACSRVEGAAAPAPAGSATDSDGKPVTGTSPAGSVEAPLAPTPDAVPADEPGADTGRRAHLNLMQVAHLADVDHEGLFIDLGTPARMKYTTGHWKTGWGQDATQGGTSFTYVAGNTGRLYFPVDVAGPLVLRVRVNAIGTGMMQPFVNGKMLQAVPMQKGAGFKEHEIAVPADVVVRGENELLLRMGDTTKVDGKDVSVAIDWVRVISGAAATNAAYEAPQYGALVQDVTVGGAKRRALRVKAPTTLSWYFEVPQEATLGLRVGLASGKSAIARVHVTPEGGKREGVFEQALAGRWQDGVVSLAKWAGSVVRIDLTAEGDGVVAWSSPALLVPAPPVAAVKPVENVIVLLIDTLRADKVRAYNPKTRVKAPVLDAFARDGALFASSQSPENWTKPSVASILTGLYPATHRTKESNSKLPDAALTLGEVFKKNKFATATFLANGYVSDKFGFKQGWDHYTNYIRENKSTSAENVFREAGDWIEKHKGERFFVYIQTIDPHVPYDPPEKFLKMYDPAEYTGQISPRQTPTQLEQAKRNPPKLTFNARDRERLEALYDAEVSYHDEQFGVFLERLKKLGLYDRMLFVVTSDHGEEFNDHGSWGHGHSVYQELLYVPLIVRWPGVVKPGTRVSEAVGTLDVAPTVLAAAGIEVPQVMEGVDRTAHARGALPPGPAVAFSDFLDDRRAIRAGRWKLILRGLNATLFDLGRDPGEKVELERSRHPIAMRYCRVMLGQFLGASDRGDWYWEKPRSVSKELGGESTDIDDKTREELKALGYAN